MPQRPVSADFQELITNTRQVSTTVLADDGEIIVLGGLIESDEQIANDSVPGLSRLPIAGRLFQNEARSVTRRNLMVFIRPVIVRGPEDMRAVTRNAYGQTVAAQRQANDGRSSLEDIVDLMMEGRSPFDRPLPSSDEEG